ncbi:SMP-30/gluconolactonase/LRE family protein [Nocardia puris]|uniref:Sugar lactone lactonase YvrE n=1 Tax=Nocardia puris TaxID=208602 RepID=A0A366DCH5_9NOCA|nr:superoxide dismutase [Nocardia puris]RBO87762.1 hypothetical protein DFR74_11015 [Nocardia puris]
MSATRLTAVAVLAAVLAACGSAEPEARVQTAYELPGDRVYPEGIALEPNTGVTYVGSYEDGSVYRAEPGAPRAEVFLPAGADGRATANGLAVDPQGRLWVTDSTKGVTVYDTTSRTALARFDVPDDDPRFVNDVTITPDGTAYLTDSVRAVLYRVTPDQVREAAAQGGSGALTPAFDLTPELAPREAGAASLNGIVAAESGRHLLAVDMIAGHLYRVDLTGAAPAIRRVALDGGDLRNGDGLALRGDTLWVVHNMDETVSRWTLTDDAAAARLDDRFTDESLDVPTTLVRSGDRLLVVASQFDKGGPAGPGTPGPFRVVTVDGI